MPDKYQIVVADRIHELEKKVNELFDCGWVCNGGMAVEKVERIGGSQAKYYQSMEYKPYQH
jgi:hypothetical protein